jgi:hypothetical protein
MISRFDDLIERVILLNHQLAPIKHHIGSEVRDLLYHKLWAIVEELNLSLNLGLDNTALDLTVEGDRLRIHFWSGSGGSTEKEVDIFIDRTFTICRETTDLPSGKVATTRTLRA